MRVSFITNLVELSSFHNNLSTFWFLLSFVASNNPPFPSTYPSFSDELLLPLKPMSIPLPAAPVPKSVSFHPSSNSADQKLDVRVSATIGRVQNPTTNCLMEDHAPHSFNESPTIHFRDFPLAEQPSAHPMGCEWNSWASFLNATRGTRQFLYYDLNYLSYKFPIQLLSAGKMIKEAAIHKC